MRDRPQLQTRIPLQTPTDEYTHLEVTAFYSDGGVNFVYGERNPKGYALSFRGIKVAPDGSFSFMMFTGWNRAFLLQPATRFSRATLTKLWAQLPITELAAKFEAGELDAIRKAIKPLAA